MIPPDKVLEFARECGLTTYSGHIPIKEFQRFAALCCEWQKNKDAEICTALAASHKRDTNGECDEFCEIVSAFETCAAAIRRQR